MNSTSSLANKAHLTARRRESVSQQSGPYNPLLVRHKKFYHPYAQVQTPSEKWAEFFTDCLESSWFFFYDCVGWLLDKLWGIIVCIILIPIAVFGLIFDKLRHLVKKVSAQAFLN